MKKSVKITLAAAGAAVLIGAVISAAAISSGAGKADRGAMLKAETITEKITSINIDSDCDDIVIVPAFPDHTDEITGEASVIYAENEMKKCNVSVQNGVLEIKNVLDIERKRKWYEYINLDFFGDRITKKIQIYVPEDFEADMRIKSRYGDVSVSGVSGSLDAELDCGDIEAEDCTFTQLSCTAEYGDIEIKRTAAQNITVNSDCGDIELEDVDGNITSESDFGDISFENISGNSLIFSSRCGDVEGVICGKKADYEPGGAKRLEAKADAGDVRISFTE